MQSLLWHMKLRKSKKCKIKLNHYAQSFDFFYFLSFPEPIHSKTKKQNEIICILNFIWAKVFSQTTKLSRKSCLFQEFIGFKRVFIDFEAGEFIWHRNQSGCKMICHWNGNGIVIEMVMVLNWNWILFYFDNPYPSVHHANRNTNKFQQHFCVE